MTANRPRRRGITSGSGFGFDDVGLPVRVEVPVPSEPLSGGVVGAADGCERDGAWGFAWGPIHEVVRPITTEMETRDRDALKPAPRPGADEGAAWAMPAAEFRVQRPGGDRRDAAHAPEGGLVHQALEHQPVLVRRLGPDGRVTHRKGLGAGVAAVAFGAGPGGALPAGVRRTGGDSEAVTGPVQVGAGGGRGDAQGGAETRALLSEALVTLERRILAAGGALEHGQLPARTDPRLAVALRAAPRALGGWDAVLLTVRILAEVNRDPAVLGRHSRHGPCGRCLPHGVIPLSSVR